MDDQLMQSLLEATTALNTSPTLQFQRHPRQGLPLSDLRLESRLG